MSDTLYIVDTLSLVFQVYHAIRQPMTGSRGQPTNALFAFTGDLEHLLKDKHPPHLPCPNDPTGHGARTNTYAASAERSADVYVFCLLTGTNREHVDPLDVAQWTFYVLPTSVLNRKVGVQKRIRLEPLIALGPYQCTYGDLNGVIHQAAEVNRGS